MSTVSVCEIFTSIQGESTWAGWPCWFVRLAGCNLRCRYCDTRRAWGPGQDADVTDLAAACAVSPAPLAEITGGEPLAQSGFGALAAALAALPGKTILVETNGSLDIAVIPARVIAIVDLKCPGSGEAERMDERNLARLRPHDEVKCVIGDRADYEWAAERVRRHGLVARCRAVSFGAVSGVLDPAELGRWILADGLPVRLQVQLHKLIGMA